MPTRDDRGRPTANRAASNVISDGDASDSTATEDRFCCTSLTLDERMTAARFAIHCGVDRCARRVLRGDS